MVYDAQGTEDAARHARPRRGRPAHGRRRGRRGARPLRGGLGPVRRGLRPPLGRRPGHPADGDRPLRPATTTTRSGTAPSWCSATATARSSTASPSRSTSRSHEFTHGVTQFTAGLTYQGQSGALNESVSDVFASMAKQRALGQTADQADWLIGVGPVPARREGDRAALDARAGHRVRRPAAGPRPPGREHGRLRRHRGGQRRACTSTPGIPNRAFALAATGIGGNSWERPGQVWYAALTGGAVTAVHRLRRLRPGDGRRGDPALPRRRRRWPQHVTAGLAAGRPAAGRLGRRWPRSRRPAAPAPAAPAARATGRSPARRTCPGRRAGRCRARSGDDVVAVRRTRRVHGRHPVRRDEPRPTTRPADELRRLLDQISVSGLSPVGAAAGPLHLHGGVPVVRAHGARAGPHARAHPGRADRAGPAGPLSGRPVRSSVRDGRVTP